MNEQDRVTTVAPFLYGRIWLHWLDTNEVRTLSGRAYRLWVLLHAHAAGQDHTDPFKEALAAESGIHEDNLQGLFKELEGAGLLRREVGNGYGRAVGRKATRYLLLSPPSVRDREAQARSVLSGGVVLTPSSENEGVKKDHREGVKKDHREGVKKDHREGVKKDHLSGSNSQDLSQNSSQDTLPEPAAPDCVSPSDFSEIGKEQPGTANRADLPAAGATRPAEEPGAPRAQVKNGPASPEWPHGEPSHPLADFADTVRRDLDQAFEEYERAEEDRDTRAQVERNGSTPGSQRAQGSSWTRAGAILPVMNGAGKPPGGTRPAGDIEDGRAQVESVPSTNTFKLSPRLQLKADARDLVVGWLQGRRMNRSPLPAELAYGIDLVTAYGLDGALEAVIAGNAALKDRNMLDGTMTFCGLKTVLADANKEAV